jgi:class 3 adenylate cyclase
MAEERAQHRVAAILAADVVGCSRLMVVDEAYERHELSKEGEHAQGSDSRADV